MNKKSKIALRLQNLVFYILFLTMIGLLAWLGKTYHKGYDLTHNQLNSLNESTQKLLRNLKQPLKFVAFVPDDATVHSGLKKFVEKYRKVKKDTTLEFVNPDLDPQRAKQEGIEYSGQLLIKLGDKSEAINSVDEQLIVNVLQRLSREKKRLVIFIEGHGERDPFDDKSSGMSKFVSKMQKQGFKIQPHNLLRTQSIPQNTSFVVIAAPNKDYLDGEVKILSDYIKKGGNLLWLNEPGGIFSLDDLEQQLGLEIQEGTLLDANTALQNMLGIKHPAVIAIIDYSDSKLTTDLTTHTLFPFATAIEKTEENEESNENKDEAGDQSSDKSATKNAWKYQPLLTTLPTSWLEFGDIQGNVKYDDETDKPGPLDIAQALTRPKADSKKQQRVFVIGDSNFMLNSFIGQGSNLELASNIFNWLGEDDELLSIKPVTAPDSTLNLPGWALYGSALFFLLILPIGLLLFGFIRWIRRRKR